MNTTIPRQFILAGFPFPVFINEVSPWDFILAGAIYFNGDIVMAPFLVNW